MNRSRSPKSRPSHGSIAFGIILHRDASDLRQHVHDDADGRRQRSNGHVDGQQNPKMNRVNAQSHRDGHDDRNGHDNNRAGLHDTSEEEVNEIQSNQQG